MLTVAQQHPHRPTPTCPICEAPMVITPTVQFHYAAGFDEVVYDCEKCRTVSTIMIDQGQTTWIAQSRSS
jgi:hypothetical protein